MNADQVTPRKRSSVRRGSAQESTTALYQAEYSQANENLRFSFSMELAYVRFHMNSTVLLLGAYWFTADVDLLRRLLSLIGAIISASGIIVEYRTIQYYRYFFDAIKSIEKDHKLTQMSFLTTHVTAPPLGLRTSHMIYALFIIGLLFWIVNLFSDVMHLTWFSDMLLRLRDAKRALLR